MFAVAQIVFFFFFVEIVAGLLVLTRVAIYLLYLLYALGRGWWLLADLFGLPFFSPRGQCFTSYMHIRMIGVLMIISMGHGQGWISIKHVLLVLFLLRRTYTVSIYSECDVYVYHDVCVCARFVHRYV